MKRIWLGRHGKAPHNRGDADATFGGGRLDNNLTQQGVDATNILANEIYKHCGVDIILCSKMKRSHQTAEIIANKLGELGHDVPIIEIDDLQEVDVGDFTECTEREARKINFHAAEAFYQGKIDGWDFPNGENYKDLSLRVSSVIVQILELTKKYNNIFVVGHGMFNRVICFELFPDRDDLWKDRTYPHDRVIMLDLENCNL
ncbi:MAG: histidine phosphatase family protein [Patescibacteria group bacterium]